MSLKNLLLKLRHAILCSSANENDSSPEFTIQIGFPTDVRRVDISDMIPGLTDSERRDIREKASRDAITNLANPPLESLHGPTSLPTTSRKGSSSCQETPCAARPPTPRDSQLVTSVPSSPSLYPASSAATSLFASRDQPIIVAPEHLAAFVPALPRDLYSCASSSPMRTEGTSAIVERQTSGHCGDGGFEGGETALQGGNAEIVYSELAASDIWFEVGLEHENLRSHVSTEEGVEGSSVEGVFGGEVVGCGMADKGARNEMILKKGSGNPITRSEGCVSLLDDETVDNVVEEEEAGRGCNGSGNMKVKAPGGKDS